jgi:hypothetical protein
LVMATAVGQPRGKPREPEGFGAYRQRVCLRPDRRGSEGHSRCKDAWRVDSAVFDEDNLVSHAGVMSVLELAGLSRLLDEHVRFVDERVKSGAANSTPKLTSIIVGMLTGRTASMTRRDPVRRDEEGVRGVYASATLGIFLREFTHGHTRQLHQHTISLQPNVPVQPPRVVFPG